MIISRKYIEWYEDVNQLWLQVGVKTSKLNNSQSQYNIKHIVCKEWNKVESRGRNKDFSWLTDRTIPPPNYPESFPWVGYLPVSFPSYNPLPPNYYPLEPPAELSNKDAVGLGAVTGAGVGALAHPTVKN